MFVVLVVLGLLAYWITAHSIKQRNFNAKLKNFPSSKSTYPILGDVHVWSFMKWSFNDKVKHFIDVMRSYPSTIKVWFGSKLVIIINNPEDIKTILTSPNCTDKSSIYHNTIGGDGLFVADGNKWKNQRRHLNTTFSPRILNSYSSEFNQYGRNLVAAIKEYATTGKEFDVTPTLGTYGTDLMARTIYGTQQKLEVSKHCYELVEHLLAFWGERMLQKYFHIFIVLIRKIFRIQSDDMKWNKGLRGILQPIVLQKMKEYQDNLKLHKNEDNSNIIISKDEHFLEKLTRLQFEGAISKSEYRFTSMTMFLAGTETTARAISIIILMLAIHEEHQKKLYEEICNFYEMYGTTDDNVDITKLNELNLLVRFIKETFRIFPVTPFLGRTPSHDITIKEGVIPAGTDILISLTNLHQHPHIWGENALKFNPDNFLPDAVANRDTCSYIPFSYGPRNCIGSKYAQITINTAVIYLLKTYKFKTTLKHEDIKIGYGVTVHVINGNFVSVQERNLKNK